MYLIFGSELDPCCVQVHSILSARGHSVRWIEGIFSEPHRFVWKFAGGGPRGAGRSRIGMAGEWEADSAEIEGVLMRDTVWSVPGDWSEKDAQYMSAEMQAALLGWLWSLPGLVVNRPPAWLFYRPRPPFLYWTPHLHRAGLRTLGTVISNDIKQLKDWQAQHADGALFSPLASQGHFQLKTGAEWEGVLRVAGHAPVVLEQAHGPAQLACVVGERVVWDRAGTRPQALEARLLDFAKSAGLDFLQIALAETPDANREGSAGLAVVGVEALVEFPRFSQPSQKAVAEALANWWTGLGSGVGSRALTPECAAVDGGVGDDSGLRRVGRRGDRTGVCAAGSVRL